MSCLVSRLAQKIAAPRQHGKSALFYHSFLWNFYGKTSPVQFQDQLTWVLDTSHTYSWNEKSSPFSIGVKVRKYKMDQNGLSGQCWAPRKPSKKKRPLKTHTSSISTRSVASSPAAFHKGLSSSGVWRLDSVLLQALFRWNKRGSFHHCFQTRPRKARLWVQDFLRAWVSKGLFPKVCSVEFEMT